MGDEETINPDFLQGPHHSSAEGEAMPAIIMLSGILIGRKFVLSQDKYTIGRGSGVEIDTRDDTVSRSHAELSKQNGRVIIQDLKSQNGIYVNNCKIDKWTLKDGDIVRLGNTIFQFVQSKEKKVFQFGAVKITV
jgi:pSer/pThr/pTyr-binding forkhead associated (FHA) protein